MTSKPVAVPSSVTAGGGNAKIIASRMPESARIALLATAWARSSGRLRRSQSRSLTKVMPWFWPRPAKPNPEMFMHDSTASFWSSRKWRRTFVWTSWVCSSVEPTGSWTWVMMEPWSSSGR